MPGNRDSEYVKHLRMDRHPIWKGRSSLLNAVDVELTERCNNNCIHCYINLPANDRRAQKREMSAESLAAFFEEAASLGCMKIRLTGGEPLLRNDFVEIYMAARRIGMKVILFTNACLFTPEIVALLRRIPPLEKVEVSLYGITRKTYESVSRMPGSFQAAMQGIQQLVENRIPLVIKGAYLPANKQERKQMEKWALSIPGVEKTPSLALFFHLRSRRENADKNREIRRLRVSSEEALAVMTENREQYIEGRREFCARFMRPPGDCLLTCNAGDGSVSLDAYGSLKPCLLLGHPDTVTAWKPGNLRAVLQEFFPEVRAKKAANQAYLKRCARCFLQGLCEQCPAQSWMEHGNLDTPVEYLCEVAHAVARDLKLLKAGEKAWEVHDWKNRVEQFSRGQDDDDDFDSSSNQKNDKEQNGDANS